MSAYRVPPPPDPWIVAEPRERLDFEQRYLRMRLALLATPLLIYLAVGPSAAAVAVLVVAAVAISCGFSVYLISRHPGILLRLQLVLRLFDLVLCYYILLLYHGYLHNAYYDSVYLLFVVVATATHGRRGTLLLATAGGVAVLAGRLQLISRGVFPFAVRHITDSIFYGLFFAITGFAVAFLMRKSAEAVQLREWVWRAVLTNLADGLIALDEQDRITLINPAAERVCGYTSAELLGQPFSLLLGAGDGLLSAGWAEKAGSLGVPCEVVGRRKGGHIFPLELTLSALQFDQRRLLIGTVRDITARKAAEDERALLLAREQVARAEAEAAVGQRDNVLSAVSHDLKNPLTAIIWQTQLLQRGIQTTRGIAAEALTQGLTRIDTNAVKMAHLLNELLDVAHVQAGQPLTLRREHMDLVALSRRVVAEQTPDAGRHHVAVVTERAEVIGLWDAFRVERVLVNLLSNAIKYSPEGGDITITVGQDGDAWAVVTVQDHGVGIPTGDLPRIFERFRRAGNVGYTQGTGIGLAVVSEIVQRHGGHTAVKSEEGKGSTFIIRLPLAQVQQLATSS